MTSIDDLFKKPSLPSNKRKLEPARDAHEVYKANKTSANGDVKSNGRATVEDEEDDDGVAGPELPPDFEEEVVDDDEGRFFGGGITDNTAEVLNFIDERDKDDIKPEKIDSAWLRKLALNFEKRISKNTELRSKFEDTPEKFMGSEADLDADIKALSILSEHPNLYEEFAKLGCVSSLVSLLSHENTDIAIDVIEIINELTDEDVEAEQAQWNALVNAMLEADLLNLLYENISRLDEANESDRAGVYHLLGVIENLSSRPSIASLICTSTSLIKFLLARSQKAETPVTQNKQYAAEILAILLQSSPANRLQLIEQDGIDTLLQLLSPYRKRDPEKGTEEEEYVENIFDCLTCCLDATPGKSKFVDAEGIELCLIMLRDGKMSRPRALRLLDHALAGPDGGACCEKLVEAAGLKPIFSLLMKKHDHQMTEHLLGILSSLLRSLPADSAQRIRLLAKFVEKDYEKLTRLVQIRHDYASKLSPIDQAIAEERTHLPLEEQDDRADAWFSRRLDAGLFSLQTVDVILAWLVAEDSGAKAKIQDLLAERDENFGDLRKTLREQLEGMDARGNDEDGDDGVMKDMLGTLVGFLE